MSAKIINLEEKKNEQKQFTINPSDLAGLAAHSSGVFNEKYVQERYGHLLNKNTEPEVEKETATE